MIVTVEKPFTGPPDWAKSYLGANVRTPDGYGRVLEVHVDPSKRIVALKVFVEAKKVKTKENHGN